MKKTLCTVAGLAAMGLLPLTASAVPLSLTKLSGITGGSVAGTAVYKADLSSVGIGTLLSITIADNSAGLGGAAGQFTGFDLDAIKLSTDDCSDAACAKGASELSVFDFGIGTIFTPGTQRAPADPKLFGTGPTGNTVDDVVATLALFDGESIAGPGAAGFLSLGDNGILSFNLTSAASTSGLFLYIGEVGDNGEVAASNIQIRESRIPEPGTLALIALGLAPLGLRRRRRN